MENRCERSVCLEKKKRKFFFLGIKSILTKRRTEVYKAAHSLDELARSLSHSVVDLQNKTVKLVETANVWEISRWLFVLGKF